MQLARRGAHVALSYFKSREPMEALAGQIKCLGVRSLAHQADLRQAADAEALVKATVETLGSLDVLVNMASEFHATPFDELTPEVFNEHLLGNLQPAFLTSLAASKVMRKQPVVDGLQGKIINFVDWAVDRPYRGFLPYMVAKGAVATLTKALAVELAPTISVNGIAPAMIDPPPNLSPEEIESIRQASPLERIGRPEDANNLVLYLLEGTDFTTGNIYRIDGGRFLGRD